MFNRSASVDREVSKSRGAGRSSVFAGILTATVLFLSLNREALAEDSPPEPSGHVLLYTDNTPGAIVYAHGHLWAANRQNYDVHVVTNVDDFVSALPTMSWNYVIVSEKHSEGAPAYTTAIGTFLEAGSWALIYRWKEDPNEPPSANQIVQAPTAIHVWANGDTAWGYYLSKLDFKKSSGISTGYSTKTFEAVEVQQTSIANTVGMAALEAGIHAAAASAPPENQSCEDLFHAAVLQMQEDYVKRNEDCFCAYGPKPLNLPPSPGDPEKLKKCLNEAADIMRSEVAKIVHDYFVCVDIRTAESQ